MNKINRVSRSYESLESETANFLFFFARCLLVVFAQGLVGVNLACADLMEVGYKYDSIEKNNFPSLGQEGVYNYAPSIMKEGDTYKAWWCGGPTDRIMYATANNLRGPWTTAKTVFAASGQLEAKFDGAMTCDPSVVKVGAVYYMYYTGYPSFVNQLNGGTTYITKIGIASSADGINWTRLNNGNPIVTPFQTTNDGKKLYGAGHPSVTYAKGKYYLSYSDSTGNDYGGLGQFILRSGDPLFKNGVEELKASGWVALASGAKPTTSYAPIRDAVNVDWAYVPAINKFAVAINGNHNAMSVRFYDFNISTLPSATQHIEGVWNEAPGIARNPDGSLTVSNNKLAISLGRSLGCDSVRESWRIAFSTMVLNTTQTANQRTIIKPPAAYDFDGNGISDRAIWRPSNGTWYVRLDSGYSCIKQHGLPGDIPVLGRYKHTVDNAERNPYSLYLFTVFRPSNGNWYMWTPPFTDSVVQWGLPGDVPVPGDYNNDGTTDFAVWRPSTGTWHIKGVKSEAWGRQGDIPVPLSDDRDPAKIVFWRPSNGTWYLKSNNLSAQFGLAKDVPIGQPGNLVGGGLHEYAVYRPTEGLWIFPTSPHTSIQYGLSGDVPIVGDFDGNGYNDISIWRPSNGNWYTFGQAAVQWGLPGDIPVNIPPSVFRSIFR